MNADIAYEVMLQAGFDSERAEEVAEAIEESKESGIKILNYSCSEVDPEDEGYELIAEKVQVENCFYNIYWREEEE